MVTMELMNIKLNAQCKLYTIKRMHNVSHTPWTNWAQSKLYVPKPMHNVNHTPWTNWAQSKLYAPQHTQTMCTIHYKHCAQCKLHLKHNTQCKPHAVTTLSTMYTTYQHNTQCKPHPMNTVHNVNYTYNTHLYAQCVTNAQCKQL